MRGIAPGEWSPLLQAWVALLGVDLLLRVRGYAWLQARVLASRRRPPSRPAVDRSRIDRLFHLVAIAARHHVRPMLCLRRALALQWLLARHGVEAVVCLGVARSEDGLDAHAWLECGGEVIGESSQVRSSYQVLDGAERRE